MLGKIQAYLMFSIILWAFFSNGLFAHESPANHDHAKDKDREHGHDKDKEKSCKKNIRIRDYNDLRFGEFSVTSPGSISIDPNGFTTTTGGIHFLDANTANAQLKVEGCPEQKYQIGLPEVTSLRSKSSGKMRLDSFTSQPANIGELNAYGEQFFQVGGTLHASPDQQAGKYRGRFRVEVTAIYE